MRQMKKRVIYSNYDIWDDYEKDARELLLERDVQDPTEQQIWDECSFLSEMEWSDGMAIEAEYYEDDRKVNNLSSSEYDVFISKMEWLIKYSLRFVMNFPIEVELEKDTGDDDVISILRVFVPYDAGKKVYKRVGTILERLSPFWTDWN